MFKKKIDRYRWLLIIEMVFVLIVLLSCFQKERLVYSACGEDMGGADKRI